MIEETEEFLTKQSHLINRLQAILNQWLNYGSKSDDFLSTCQALESLLAGYSTLIGLKQAQLEDNDFAKTQDEFRKDFEEKSQRMKEARADMDKRLKRY